MKENKGIMVGVGGIKCPCCQPVSGLKASRILVNRAIRRQAKINIRKEMEMAGETGFEPVSSVLETAMLPLTPLP